MYHIKTCDKSLVKSCVGLKIDQFSQYHAVGAVMKLTFAKITTGPKVYSWIPLVPAVAEQLVLSVQCVFCPSENIQITINIVESPVSPSIHDLNLQISLSFPARMKVGVE